MRIGGISVPIRFIHLRYKDILRAGLCVCVVTKHIFILFCTRNQRILFQGIQFLNRLYYFLIIRIYIYSVIIGEVSRPMQSNFRKQGISRTFVYLSRWGICVQQIRCFFTQINRIIICFLQSSSWKFQFLSSTLVATGNGANII